MADAEILYAVMLDRLFVRLKPPESVNRTTAGGKFRFEIPHPEPEKWDRVDIIATHPDYALGWQNLSPQSTADIELQLGTPSLISGRIMNETGEPIPSADIEREHHLSNQTILSWSGTVAMTDGNGWFQDVELIIGDEYVISAGAKGYQQAETTQFTARAEMTEIETLILPVAGQFFIEGRLTDTLGEPVQGAYIYTYTYTHRPSQDWRTHTDENGDYRLDTLPMDVLSRLDIIHHKYANHIFKQLKTNQRHDFVLVKADGYLIGKVVDADGKPIARAWVRMPTEEDSTTGYQYEQDWTNVHGEFELKHIKDVVVSLSVTKKDPGEFFYVTDDDDSQIFEDIAVNQRNLVLTLTLDELIPRN